MLHSCCQNHIKSDIVYRASSQGLTTIAVLYSGPETNGDNLFGRQSDRTDSNLILGPLCLWHVQKKIFIYLVIENMQTGYKLSECVSLFNICTKRSTTSSCWGIEGRWKPVMLYVPHLREPWGRTERTGLLMSDESTSCVYILVIQSNFDMV